MDTNVTLTVLDFLRHYDLSFSVIPSSILVSLYRVLITHRDHYTLGFDHKIRPPSLPLTKLSLSFILPSWWGVQSRDSGFLFVVHPFRRGLRTVLFVPLVLSRSKTVFSISCEFSFPTLIPPKWLLLDAVGLPSFPKVWRSSLFSLPVLLYFLVCLYPSKWKRVIIFYLHY